MSRIKEMLLSETAVVRAHWDPRLRIQRPGWYAWFESGGTTIVGSTDELFPVDVSKFGRGRGVALRHELEDAFPGARVEVKES